MKKLSLMLISFVSAFFIINTIGSATLITNEDAKAIALSYGQIIWEANFQSDDGVTYYDIDKNEPSVLVFTLYSGEGQLPDNLNIYKNVALGRVIRKEGENIFNEGINSNDISLKSKGFKQIIEGW